MPRYSTVRVLSALQLGHELRASVSFHDDDDWHAYQDHVVAVLRPEKQLPSARHPARRVEWGSVVKMHKKLIAQSQADGTTVVVAAAPAAANSAAANSSVVAAPTSASESTCDVTATPPREASAAAASNSLPMPPLPPPPPQPSPAPLQQPSRAELGDAGPTHCSSEPPTSARAPEPTNMLFGLPFHWVPQALPSNKWISEHAPLLDQLEVGQPVLTPSARHAELPLRGHFVGQEGQALVDEERVRYSLPPSAGEPPAAGAQRNERHRKREKAAIRRLEAEAENPGAKQRAEQSRAMSRAFDDYAMRQRREASMLLYERLGIDDGYCGADVDDFFPSISELPSSHRRTPILLPRRPSDHAAHPTTPRQPPRLIPPAVPPSDPPPPNRIWSSLYQQHLLQLPPPGKWVQNQKVMTTYGYGAEKPPANAWHELRPTGGEPIQKVHTSSFTESARCNAGKCDDWSWVPDDPALAKMEVRGQQVEDVLGADVFFLRDTTAACYSDRVSCQEQLVSNAHTAAKEAQHRCEVLDAVAAVAADKQKTAGRRQTHVSRCVAEMLSQLEDEERGKARALAETAAAEACEQEAILRNITRYVIHCICAKCADKRAASLGMSYEVVSAERALLYTSSMRLHERSARSEAILQQQKEDDRMAALQRRLDDVRKEQRWWLGEAHRNKRWASEEETAECFTEAKRAKREARQLQREMNCAHTNEEAQEASDDCGEHAACNVIAEERDTFGWDMM